MRYICGSCGRRAAPQYFVNPTLCTVCAGEEGRERIGTEPSDDDNGDDEGDRGRGKGHGKGGGRR